MGPIDKGSRVKLVSMPNDPDPVPAGTLGTVTSSRLIEGLTPRPYLQVGVSWDNGRSLGLVIPPDAIELVPEKPKCDFCSSPDATWVYPSKDFTLIPEYRWGSTGGWAACQPCSDLIEADDYAGLTERSLSYLKISTEVPGFGQALANLHLEFREARTGPKVEYHGASQQG
jgi:hypothetical protein